MDYGHSLQFGTFVTPVNDPPQAAVAMAQLSEQLGFDLVTFQDHPYQPGFLDTWTLLSWVAAQTTKIHISGNVLNIPMRPAPVLARAAASLDLLSGGRLALGLGAGGFWDAMAAMGVPRRTPAESVEQLSEAIDVIREVWRADDRAQLRYPGKYYQLKGAKRGPAPAHEVPIWLGAYKPRMLRLIGAKADGWLPSLSYLKPGDLAKGNAIIDEAAAEKGRDPREIRRLLNIFGDPSKSAAQWVDEIVPMVLEDGIGTVIIGSDDPGELERFAEEVIPAVREAVAATRKPVAGPVRSAAKLAKRREGIDYDGLPASLTAIEPGDFSYAKVRSTYMRGGSPGLVIQPTDAEQVVEALAFARDQKVALAVRSGGHGISGRSTNDGGIVIDLSRMREITVLSSEDRLVRVEAGARWKDVAAALAPHGWALSSGDYGGVGVGGLATAGGIGWLAREHGLTIDHLRAADMVLADGSRVHVSADEHPDLFWAVRGAGANFGIVTAFEFQVDEVGDVGFGQFVYDASDAAGLLERWGAAMEAAPRDVTTNLIMGPPRRGQALAQVYGVVDSSTPDTIIDRLTPIAQIAPLLDQQVQLVPYAGVMNVPDAPHDGQGDPVARSGLIEHLTPEFAAAAAALIASGTVYFFQVRSVGGAVADIPDEATSYSHRSANFSVVAFGASKSRLDAAWQELATHFRGLYLSFETDQRPERVEEAWPPATLVRLRALKRQYDPANLFRDNFNIDPLGD
ncbi:LLM class flavin-dependent oxidoreductase [Paractinoplanes globisporus]|uniref:LLM class flavin-dependent oxidoreductase n=1 Tax=Paractinoplanes globisporus TaxID=113565 RepID=A0ABW6WPX4_9ACTN|nr:LLM class flavin-dependent oxidoreductase [Actinoplanes globisporus]